MTHVAASIPAGAPAPVAGAYQCTALGCTASFVASLAGAPLPTAHHAGAAWRLASVPGSAPRAGKPAEALPPPSSPAPPSPISPAAPKAGSAPTSSPAPRAGEKRPRPGGPRKPS